MMERRKNVWSNVRHLIQNTIPALVLSMAVFIGGCIPVKFGKNEFSTSNSPINPSGTTTTTSPGGTTTTTQPGSPTTTTTGPGTTTTTSGWPTTTTTVGVNTRDVNFQTTVSTNNRLDILLVIDDSNSMLADNKKLAEKLEGFVNSLQSSSIDWQMCVTVTRPLPVSGTSTWGASIVWTNYTPATGTPRWVLKSTTNAATIFNSTINTIGAGWANTDDERGIKSTWWHLYNGDVRSGNNSGCYRADAAFATILISDEDERSVGGVQADQHYAGEYKVLESDDAPEAVVRQVKDIFGASKRFTFNSIIVKPNDSACMATQDAQGSKSHYGRKYDALSKLTGGGIGSICAADYTTNLNLFKDVIEDSIASFALECNPVGAVTATVTPAVAGLTYSIQGQSVVFSPKIPNGRTLRLQYKCPL